MPKKSDAPGRTHKENKGNKTVISPGEKTISQYAASTVTSYKNKGDKPPGMRDSDVASARHFVQENKK